MQPQGCYCLFFWGSGLHSLNTSRDWGLAEVKLHFGFGGTANPLTPIFTGPPHSSSWSPLTWHPICPLPQFHFLLSILQNWVQSFVISHLPLLSFQLAWKERRGTRIQLQHLLTGGKGRTFCGWGLLRVYVWAGVGFTSSSEEHPGVESFDSQWDSSQTPSPLGLFCHRWIRLSSTTWLTVVVRIALLLLRRGLGVASA